MRPLYLARQEPGDRAMADAKPRGQRLLCKAAPLHLIGDAPR